jgi:hypothetical protein
MQIRMFYEELLVDILKRVRPALFKECGRTLLLAIRRFRPAFKVDVLTDFVVRVHRGLKQSSAHICGARARGRRPGMRVERSFPHLQSTIRRADSVREYANISGHED